jgi:GGDEF domain-containing protein
VRVRIQSTHFVPPLLALLAILALPLAVRAGVLPRNLPPAFLPPLPYILFLLVAFLALRLNQFAAFGSALLLILAHWMLSRALPAPFLGSGLAFYACALSLTVPAGLMLLWVPGEGRMLGPRGLLDLAAVGLPFAFLLVRRLRPLWIAGLFNLGLLPALPGWRLPDGALALAAGLGVLLAARRPDGAGPFRYALLWALFPFLKALNALLSALPPYATFGLPVAPSALSLPLDLSLSTVSLFLILLYGLYRLYWQRVYLDELTGIPNRRAFNERLARLGRRYALAMIDIDHFKAFNDTYGHAEGDNVLRWVATHIAEDSGFQAYRYGGEEFALVFSAARSRQAGACLERIRRRLEETDFFIRSPGRPKGGGRPWRRLGRPRVKRVRVRITVSAGVCAAGEAGTPRAAEETLRVADQALYQAKKLGRNRVVARQAREGKGRTGRKAAGP